MSTTLERRASTHRPVTVARSDSVVRRAVACLYLVSGGINAGIALADAETYRTFADTSFLPFVTDAWRSVVMAHPVVWILALAVGEIALGVLLLMGGRAARAGWVGVIAFHVMLMLFGFGFWLWCVPALAVLVPAAVRDWPRLAQAPRPVAIARPAPPAVAPEDLEPPDHAPGLGRSPAVLWSSLVLAAAVVAASLYGLLGDAPYGGLPDETVVAARAQDACSILVAALLVALAARPPSVRTDLARLGLLGYFAYSYLIYVTGVPMNRMFLVYVLIVALSAAGLVTGLVRLGVRTVPVSSAGPRMVRGTGWMLVVTAVLFGSLWLSMLLPFALGGARPETEGVGGTPYPVFWLDLGLVLPAIAAIGFLLLRRHRAGPPLAVVALIKIVTLFTALWAGPVLALITDEHVHLGPDAVPSLLLLAASSWLSVRWIRSFPGGTS
jgi:hypothetical protein